MMIDMIILSFFREKFVLISNVIIIVSFGWICGQNIEIKSLNPNIVTDTLFSILESDENLSTEFQLKFYSIESNQSTYKRVHIEQSLDSIIFSGLDNFRPSFSKRLKTPFQNTNVGEGFSKIGKTIFHRYYFLNGLPQIKYGLFDQEKLGAIIHFRPDFQSNFSGLFGVSQNKEDWDITGEINFHLENLMQTAGMIDLKWKRVDSLSQLIKFQIVEPHPLGIDFGIDFQYHHELIGGYYTFIEKKSLLNIYLPWEAQSKIGIISGVTTPTLNGELNGYNKIAFKAFSFSLLRDSRNERLLPNRGQFFCVDMDLGLQDKSTFLKSKFDYQYYHSLKSKVHVFFQLRLNNIHDFEKPVPKSRYMFYGGTSTLRGYKEQSFASPNFQIATLEFGFQPVREFEGKVFLDGVLDETVEGEPLKYGYGFGITQINKNTLIQIEYALSKEGGINDGKLHIKWVSRL